MRREIPTRRQDVSAAVDGPDQGTNLLFAGLHSLELDLRHDESEAGPSAGLDRAVELRTRLRGVAVDEIPVAQSIGERRDLHVGGIGGSEDSVRADLAAVQLEPA